MRNSLRSRAGTFAGVGAAVGALALGLLAAAPAQAATAGPPAYVEGGDSIPRNIGTWGNGFRMVAGSGPGERALTVHGASVSMDAVDGGSDQLWYAYRTGSAVQDGPTTGRRPIALANFGDEGQVRCLQVDPAGNAGLNAAVQVVTCDPTAPSTVQTWLVPDYGSIQGTVINLASFRAANNSGISSKALLASASNPSAVGLGTYYGPGTDAQFILDEQVPPARNLAAGAAVTRTTSSEEWGPWSASNLTDGVRTSQPDDKGFTSGANYVNRPEVSTQTAVIDLGSNQAVGSVVLYPRTATGGEAAATTGAGFPSTVEIYVSGDGDMWTKVASATGQSADDGQPRTYALPAGTQTRYIQVVGRLLGRIAPDDSVWRLQLAEIEAYAP